MHRNYRILIVEDRKSWQNILLRASALPHSDVKIASDIDEARDLLKQNFFHLAIIDLSLVRNNPLDTKGVILSNEIYESGLFNATKVIIVSAYGNKQRIREAFGKNEVIDFIPKEDFDPEGFHKQISELLEKDIRLGLVIQWVDQSSAGQITSNLLIDGLRADQDEKTHKSLAEELEDLLCRLFFNAESLLVKPMSSGGSEAAVILVTPFFGSGAGHPVIVKFGPYSKIETEDGNYKLYVKKFVGDARHTNILDLRRSLRLGGIVYSLVGGANDNIRNFQEFYAGSSIEEIRKALRKLFQETCGNWYANKGKLELADLAEHYQKYLNFSWERIEEAADKGLKRVHGSDVLHFDVLQSERGFANPVKFMKGKKFPLSTYICITHGNLNPGNILLDASGYSWLIDFGAIGKGHILRDIAELDVAVRCQMLENKQAGLAERLELEEVLNKPLKFSEIPGPDDFVPKNEAVLKIYQTIVELRKIAHELVMQNPGENIKEYYIALIYYSLNSLRFYGWEAVQREHALLSASLLVQKLGVKAPA